LKKKEGLAVKTKNIRATSVIALAALMVPCPRERQVELPPVEAYY
jgi:hypothetical protein